jgi:hypothetical protein
LCLAVFRLNRCNSRTPHSQVATTRWLQVHDVAPTLATSRCTRSLSRVGRASSDTGQNEWTRRTFLRNCGMRARIARYETDFPGPSPIASMRRFFYQDKCSPRSWRPPPNWRPNIRLETLALGLRETQSSKIVLFRVNAT